MTLGQLHFYGAKGVSRDEALAAQYFQKAAAQGDAGAMTNLGHMHLSGVGVEQNNETALTYFKQAADKVFLCFFVGCSFCVFFLLPFVFFQFCAFSTRTVTDEDLSLVLHRDREACRPSTVLVSCI